MFSVLSVVFFNQIEFARAEAAAAKVSQEASLVDTSAETLKAMVKAEPTQIYFEKTGHYLGNGFLYYWRVNDGINRFGMPISEELTEDGRTVQYFEKARLEYHEEFRGTRYETSLGQLGRELLNGDPTLKANSATKPIEAKFVPSGFRYFKETGHTLVGRWRDMWERNGGLDRFGFPLTEQFDRVIDGVPYTVQIFERVEMRLKAGDDNITFSPLGYTVAKQKWVNTTFAPYDNKTPTYGPQLYEHWVDVNLRTQTARFMEGDLVVRTSLITSGKPGHETPTGTFYINRRVYNEHMRGGTIGSEDYYDLYNVLYTQYFTNEGHALHYAWWRSQFGVTGSHGCVNEDLATAKFAWDFLNIGSRVYIHY
jgi:lipoprotein-anchoring transpeptidase ErfK/SrfK